MKMAATFVSYVVELLLTAPVGLVFPAICGVAFLAILQLVGE